LASAAAVPQARRRSRSPRQTPSAESDEPSVAVTPELGHPHIGDSAADFPAMLHASCS
jgi:hypothetical protein